MTQSQIYLKIVSPYEMGYSYNTQLDPQCLRLKLYQSDTTFIINIAREECINQF